MTEYDIDALLERLMAEADPKYAAFSESLIPGGRFRMLGVRMPALRGMAKEILRGNWRGFLEASREHTVYELRMLHGMVLGGAACDITEKLRLTEAFLPHIDNWAVCDSFCSSFRPRRVEQAAVFDYCRECAESEMEFRKRFGLVMLMNRFHEPPWIDRTLAVYRGFHHEGYYARMAAAWGLATLWLSDREGALAILRENRWDPFTHNRAIQKLCESRRITPADKALVRSLRRKGDD